MQEEESHEIPLYHKKDIEENYTFSEKHDLMNQKKT